MYSIEELNEMLKEAGRKLDSLTNIPAAHDREFPVFMFPKELREMIKELNEVLCFDRNYIGASMLFAIAAAMGNTKVMQFMPGWDIKPVLFLALVGDAGSNKSAPLSWALSPLEEINSAIIKESCKLYEKYLSDKESGIHSEMPPMKQCIVTDITTEALAKVLKNNPRGICCYNDELAGWFGSFNQYKKIGRDEEFWLSAFSMKNITINRKSDAVVTNIRKPFICVAGTIQPNVLNRLLSGHSIDNGMTWRILQCYPKEDKGVYWSPATLSPNIQKDWSYIIETIYKDQKHFEETGEPELWSLSEKAREHLLGWQNQMESELRRVGTMYVIAAFRKIQEYALRFCMIIHQINMVFLKERSDVITEGEALAATTIAEYFFSEVIYTLENIEDADIADLDTRRRNFLCKLKDEFTAAEAYRLSDECHLSLATIKRFLKEYNGVFFTKTSHGQYTKTKKGKFFGSL